MHAAEGSREQVFSDRASPPKAAASVCCKTDTIDILIKTPQCLAWARDEWTNVHVGMPLIGDYILRTQCSIRRASVTVIRINPSLSASLLYWGNPAVAECFCDQTLLTPSVDNLGNSSSSLQLQPHIAVEEGVGERRLFLSFE